MRICGQKSAGSAAALCPAGFSQQFRPLEAQRDIVIIAVIVTVIAIAIAIVIIIVVVAITCGHAPADVSAPRGPRGLAAKQNIPSPSFPLL